MYGFLLAFHSNYGDILHRLRDSDLLVENREFFCTSPVFSAPAGGDPVGISWRCLMLIKIEWLGYCMVKKKLWRYVKPFSSDTGTLRTDGRTDGQICYINQYACALRNSTFLNSRQTATAVYVYSTFTARRVCIAQTMPWKDVRPSVRPSVSPSSCHMPVFCLNGYTYPQNFFTVG